MKKIFLITIMCGVIMLNGCQSVEETNVTDVSSAEECMEDFLGEFFSFDKDGRYSSAQDMDETFYEQYYEPLKNYTTQECYESLYSNRIPLKYDMAVTEKCDEVEVDEIVLKNYADDIYEFSVRVEMVADEEISLEFKGQIGVTEDGKISSLTINHENDFLNFLGK